MAGYTRRVLHGRVYQEVPGRRYIPGGAWEAVYTREAGSLYTTQGGRSLYTTLGIPYLHHPGYTTPTRIIPGSSEATQRPLGVRREEALGSILGLIMVNSPCFSFIPAKCDVWYAFLTLRKDLILGEK